MTATLIIGGAVGAYLVAPLWAPHPLLAGTNWLAVIAFATVAVLTLQDEEHRNYKWLFFGCCLCWAVGLAGSRAIGPLPVLAAIAEPLTFVFVAAVLLRYPRAGLTRRSERTFIVLLFLWLLPGRVIWVVTSDPAWYGYDEAVWWPTLLPSVGISQYVEIVYYIGAVAIALAVVAFNALRLHRSRGFDRRVLVPVLFATVGVAATVSVHVAARLGLEYRVHSTEFRHFYALEAILLLTVSFAFLVAAVRRRMARTAAADLLLGVGRLHTIDDVQAALRGALCDPTLYVLFWVAESGGYVDDSGRPAVLAAAHDGSFVTLVETSDGQPLAAVVGSPSLRRYATAVDTAVAAVGLALENAQLQARILAQLDQVRASRARIVEAGLLERRRLERDLHDGAQQRLLAVAMHLAAVSASIDDHAVRCAIDQARGELDMALHELRGLARGIHPAVLTQAGLAPALESVVEGLPLEVALDIPPQRWNFAVEATAYFLACEALTNVVKHAGATSAAVKVRPESHRLRVAVTDDGVGGANVSAGSGLAGLHDRVAALGGRLTVISPRGSGTQLIAELPCA
ncbi:sensor histidine kinase [Pseudonocardia halophobica]|uniref:sensor histidine kinase n=1 Tax=Pseudonocardia halophobica TaxID=29401 RepID=UPI003D9094D4